MPQAGANVILTARRKEALEGVLEQVKTAYKESGVQAGGKFAAITLDVSKRDEVAALWSKVPDDLRNVDILGTIVLPSSSLISLTTFASSPYTFLVNNAGFVLGVDRVGNIDDNEIDAMIATNVVGLISVSQLLVKGEICCLAS